jgi:hypothetical protein
MDDIFARPGRGLNGIREENDSSAFDFSGEIAP